MPQSKDQKLLGAIVGPPWLLNKCMDRQMEEEMERHWGQMNSRIRAEIFLKETGKRACFERRAGFENWVNMREEAARE